MSEPEARPTPGEARQKRTDLGPTQPPTAAGATSGASREGRLPWRVAAVALIVLTVAAGWLAAPGRPVPAEPSSVEIERDQIVSFDASGVEIWRHRLTYFARPPDSDRRNWSVIEDLDGDGRREVVVTVVETSLETSEVLCLESDGALRWSRRPDRRVSYGFGEMAAPWIAWHLVRTGSVAPTGPALWVAWFHRPFFGSFAERLDISSGQPRAEYWSAGYITAIAVGKAKGRPAVFIGAANNEHKAASLAVYDLGLTSGSAPAASPEYSCSDCPSGAPMAFFVFPKTDLSRAVLPDSDTTDIAHVLVDSLGQAVVEVRHVPADSAGGATVLYHFDAELCLTGAEVTGSYRIAHGKLEREGKLLTRPIIGDEERQLFPVLSWDGKRFVPIEGPQKPDE